MRSDRQAAAALPSYRPIEVLQIARAAAIGSCQDDDLARLHFRGDQRVSVLPALQIRILLCPAHLTASLARTHSKGERGSLMQDRVLTAQTLDQIARFHGEGLPVVSATSASRAWLTPGERCRPRPTASCTGSGLSLMTWSTRRRGSIRCSSCAGI